MHKHPPHPPPPPPPPPAWTYPAHTYTYTYSHMHEHTHTHTHTRTCMHTHTQKKHAQTHAHNVHTHINTPMHTHTQITHKTLPNKACKHTHTHTHTTKTCPGTHIHTHTHVHRHRHTLTHTTPVHTEHYQTKPVNIHTTDKAWVNPPSYLACAGDQRYKGGHNAFVCRLQFLRRCRQLVLQGYFGVVMFRHLCEYKKNKKHIQTERRRTLAIKAYLTVSLLESVSETGLQPSQFEQSTINELKLMLKPITLCTQHTKD